MRYQFIILFLLLSCNSDSPTASVNDCNGVAGGNAQLTEDCGCILNCTSDNDCLNGFSCMYDFTSGLATNTSPDSPVAASNCNNVCCAAATPECWACAACMSLEVWECLNPGFYPNGQTSNCDEILHLPLESYFEGETVGICVENTQLYCYESQYYTCECIISD